MVVANLAADVAAAAVVVIAIKSQSLIIRRGSGKPGLAFFIGAAPWPVCGILPLSVRPIPQQVRHMRRDHEPQPSVGTKS